jgi:hypothetical protein
MTRAALARKGLPPLEKRPSKPSITPTIGFIE